MSQPTPDSSQSCPKCNGQMERGFIIDHSHTAQAVSEWAPGPPQRSFWTGTKLPEGRLPIGTFRCSACGYLESYAHPDFAAK
jgi:transposase